MNDSNHPFDRPEFTLKKGWSKKRLGSIVIGLALILTVAGVAFYFFRQHSFNAQPLATPQTSQQRGDVDAVTLSDITAAANTHLASGNTDQAMAVFDEAIKKTNSPAQKSALYRTKAMVIASTNTPAAIKAAEQSATLNPDFEITAYLAELYERNGDKEKAIEYYGKAIVLYNRMENNEIGGPIDASLYQERIDRLRVQ
jgi:tetratricopeptide (TPR) repeat protein